MPTLTPVAYRIKPSRPEAHVFSVDCIVARPDKNGQQFELPNWIPGSYLIRDFSRHIISINAHTAQGRVKLSKLDKSSWLAAPCDGPLTLSYEVYAFDLSVRAAHLDKSHGFFNGSSVFLQVKGMTDLPCAVTLQKPDGDDYLDWRVATALRRDTAEPYDFGSYVADDYDELIDHPVEMGCFTLATFQACGVPHDIVLTGRHHADMDRLCADLKVICEHHIRFFGGDFPTDRYVFLAMVVSEGYGGLEHRASTSLLCARNSLPVAGDTEVNDDYLQFLGLCSHEYFHTWNIKRIKPDVFLPYDLKQENYTTQLWAFEGITSYYDDLALVRTGLIEPQRYLEIISYTLTRVHRFTGRHKQTISESSFDAWTKFYKQDENAPNAIVSYYAKGMMVALYFDLLIRQQTAGKKSLDDVMRLLWSRYGEKNIGVPEHGIEELINEVCERNNQKIFDQLLRSTDRVPLTELMKSAVGVELSIRPSSSQKDKGGNIAKQKMPVSDIGLRFVEHKNGVRITHVLDDGAAIDAGLSAKDVIIAIDGLRVDINNAEKIIAAYPAEAVLKIHLFRNDELFEFSVVTKTPKADTIQLNVMEPVDATLIAQRTAWLGQ